jgi:hypothetical protein
MSTSTSAPSVNRFDGIDLMPLLKDGAPFPVERVLTWRTSGVSGGGSAIQMGDWKMLVADSTQTTTLYNIRNNLAENANLSDSEPAIFADLQSRFAAWETSVIAPFYGSTSTVLDSGLERQAISGGYRLNRTANALAWLSSIFRNPQFLNADFNYRFFARSAESTISSHAADILKGDVTAELGPDFFIDQAAVGGTDTIVNEPNVGNFDKDLGTAASLNVGADGTEITITGIGWALNGSSANDAITASVTITYLGADGTFSDADDNVVLGTVSDEITYSGAGEYYWASMSAPPTPELTR